MIKKFLVDKSITLCFLLIGLIFISLFLFLSGLPISTIFYFIVLSLLIVVGWLVVSYYFLKKQLNSLEKLIDQLEAPYLIGEIIKAPSSLVADRYYQLMKIISSEAINQVEVAKKEADEYRDYLEQWVHELKTPLTALSLIVANEANPTKIKQEVSRLNNLTDQVLNFARVKSFEKDRQLENFELIEVCNQAIKNQMNLLIGSQMTVELIEINSQLLYSDKKAVFFILNQLLINSAKYSPNSQIKLRVENKQIIFEDNGIGIVSYDLPRIFDKGYTGVNGRKFGTSTGMGLFIVKKMCQELGISIEVESQEQVFTRFIIIFP